MRSQTTQESTELHALLSNGLARESLLKQHLQSLLPLLSSARRKISILDLERTALVDKFRVRPAEVPRPGVQDPINTGDLTLESLREGFGVAAHVADEDAGSVGCFALGVDDALGGGQGEGDGLFDHHMFAGLQGGDSVGFVEFIGGEVEDHVDFGAGEDVGWVGGGEGDVEFGGAVVGVLGVLATTF